MQTKHVQTVLVTDPDTGGICEVEIRKEETGALVGFDGAFLGQTDDNALSPYGNGELVIPDHEPPLTNADYARHPWHVTVDYADGVNVGVYHYPNKALAQQHVMELLAERLPNVHMDDDGGVPFATKIAQALNNGDVDKALDIYCQIPDNTDIIDYTRTLTLTDTPLKRKDLKDMLADYLEIHSS